jgi:hypothetical protein
LLRLEADLYDVFTGHPCNLVIDSVDAGIFGTGDAAAVAFRKPAVLSTIQLTSR